MAYFILLIYQVAKFIYLTEPISITPQWYSKAIHQYNQSTVG